jgi:hypothetical protein
MSSSTKDFSGFAHSSAMYLYAILFSPFFVCGSALNGPHPNGHCPSVKSFQCSFKQENKPSSMTRAMPFPPKSFVAEETHGNMGLFQNYQK